MYCAFVRLVTLPYFLDFNSVWNELDMSENFISGLPPHCFRSVRVRHIGLARNSIERLSVDAFASGPGELTGLDLSHNRLEGTEASLPPGVFEPALELRALVLSYNRVTSAQLRQRSAGSGRSIFRGLENRLLDLDLQVNSREFITARSTGK